MLLRGARLRGSDAPLDLRVRDGVLHVPPAGAHPERGEEIVDLDGRWVVPGLWDQHVHMGQWALAARRLDVGAAESAAHAVALVRSRIEAAAPDPGEVLVGQGFRDALWPDPLGDAAADLLDLGDVPVVLVSGDVHCTWANRAALRMLGRPDTDAVLREQAAFDLTREISRAPRAVLDRWVLDAAAAAAAQGVVGIRDFEMDDAPGAWAERFAAGFRGLRVRAAVYPHDLARHDARAAGSPRPTGAALDPSGLLEQGPLKLFTDGSLNTRTAWCDAPYPEGGHGEPHYDPAGLLAAAREGAARGLTPAIHAIGDRAVALALDTFAALGSGGSIEHAQLVRPADLPRFAALGVVASVQPEHAMDDRDVADDQWAGRTASSFPYAALVAARAVLAFGSDAPVAPLDPWTAMDAAVTRSRDGRDPWHPEQSLPAAAALASSSDGRWLADGDPADLVVVDRDPLEGPLRGMPVYATMLAGEWTFTA